MTIKIKSMRTESCSNFLTEYSKDKLFTERSNLSITAVKPANHKVHEIIELALKTNAFAFYKCTYC